MNFAAEELGIIKTFSFRGVSPLIINKRVSLAAQDDDPVRALSAMDEDYVMTMEAKAS